MIYKRREVSKNACVLQKVQRARKQTHEIPRDGDSLLDGRRATRVVDAVVDLCGDPGEGLTSGRGEVVAQAQEVGEEEGGEKAVSAREDDGKGQR